MEVRIRVAVIMALALAASLFFVAPAIEPAALHASSPITAETQELLDIAISRTKPMSVTRIRELISQGADVNGRGPGGVTPLIYAVETYGYQTDDTLRKATREAIEELLRSGADVSAQDGRGLNAMLYPLNYGQPAKVEDVVRLLLARNPDLGRAGHDDRIAPIHMLARSRYENAWVLREVLGDPARFNVDLTARSVQGYSVFHFGATRGLNPADGSIRIKELADRLGPAGTEALIDSPDETGAAPLVWAISTRTRDAVEYLLKNYPKIDVNRETTEGERPLDIALRLGATDIAALLSAHGATTAPVPAGITCTEANAGPISVSKLNAILAACGSRIRALEDLLPLLPKTLRSRYALSYFSRSAQRSSFENPRAILFERDAKTIVAFNGSPAHTGFGSLEVMTVNPATKTLELYDYDFSATPSTGKVKVEGPNPPRCLRCHGQTPHPNWEFWTGWPGMYFGDMLNLYPTEKAYYESYLANAKAHPRYRHLLPLTLQPEEYEWGVSDFLIPGVSYNFALNKMDGVVHAINAPRIAAEIGSEPRLRPYRYAILGALSCGDKAEDYLPAGHALPSGRPRSDIEAQLKSEADAHSAAIETFQDSVLPGGFQGRYNLETRNGATLGLNPDVYRRQFEQVRAANLMFLIEGVLGQGAMSEWSMVFAPRRNHVFSNLGSVEAFAWRRLLDPVTDADLWPHYEKAFAKMKGRDRLSAFFYKANDPNGPQVCATLRQKSLSALP